MKTMYATAIMTWPEETASTQPLDERCQSTCRSELEQLESGVSAQVLLAAVDEMAEPVKIQYRGRTIFARPLDTRRFVREMAAFVSFN